MVFPSIIILNTKKTVTVILRLDIEYSRIKLCSSSRLLFLLEYLTSLRNFTNVIILLLHVTISVVPLIAGFPYVLAIYGQDPVSYL